MGTMKTRAICLVLPLLLSSVLGMPAQTNTPPQYQPRPASSSVPFTTVVVETPETKERNGIKDRAVALLKAKDYDQLDKLAAQYRSSKERYADGFWKVFFVYDGLVPSVEVSDAEWGTRLSDLRNWILAKPDSITSRVALANVMAAYAWKARGSDWASKVTDEGWRLFEQRLNEAVKILDEAESLKEKCPFYWAVKMRTGLGLRYDRRQYDAIFSQATRFEPQYEAYYCRRAMYLLPRWYGEEGEWESDLTKSADRIGGEEGDIIYTQIVWAMNETHFYGNIFNDCKLSWSRVNRGFEIIEKRFPDSLAAKSEHAHLAALAGDARTSLRCFDQIAGKADLTVWVTQKRFERYATWAYTYGR